MSIVNVFFSTHNKYMSNTVCGLMIMLKKFLNYSPQYKVEENVMWMISTLE